MRAGSAAAFLILLMSVLSDQTLTCRPYEYLTDDGCCPMCPPGGRVHADCTENKGTLCKPCPEGTFMNHPTNRTECYSCSECDEASGLKMKTSCSIVSDSVCEPLQGFYCSEPAEGGCGQAKRHRRCDPGESIRHKGTSSTDTECSTCSDGTFSNGTFPSCQNHRQCLSEGLQLLRAGTKTEDAQCGQKPSDWTGLEVGAVVVVVVISVFVLGMICLRWWIKRYLHSGNRREIELSLEGVKSTLKGLKSEDPTLKGLKSEESEEEKKRVSGSDGSE